MFYSDKERQIMQRLFRAVNHNIIQIYVITFSDGDVVEARADTCFETDNGLDEADPGYEEYYACAMEIVKIIENKSNTLEEGKLIEINYHNYPQQIKDFQGNII